MYFKTVGGDGICFAVGATNFRCMNSNLELLWENSYGSAFASTESAVLSSDTGLAVHNDLLGSSTLRGLTLLTGKTDWTLDCSDYAVAGLDCQNGDDSAVAKRLALSVDELYVFFNPKQNWLFKSNVKLTPTEPPTLAPTMAPTLSPTLAPAEAPGSPTESPTIAPTGLPTASPSSSGTASVVGSIAYVVIGLSILM
jgi:cell division septation protein DedD